VDLNKYPQTSSSSQNFRGADIVFRIEDDVAVKVVSNYRGIAKVVMTLFWLIHAPVIRYRPQVRMALWRD
jgi:hypothetical protein